MQGRKWVFVHGLAGPDSPVIDGTHFPREVRAQTYDQQGRPHIEVIFDVTESTVEVRQVIMRRVDGGREVRNSDLPDIDRLAEVAVGRAAVEYVEGSDGRLYARDAQMRRSRKAVRKARRTRRRRVVTDDLYKKVADVYTRAEQAGHNPRVAVADHFERTLSMASTYISEARKRGHLAPHKGVQQ